MKILLLGATGLVGGHVLQQALLAPQITHIIAPVRQSLALQHEKLCAPIINFEDFAEDAQAWQFDAVICALGTTMKKATSKEAFKKIDYDYPLAFAQLAKQKAAKIYALNSAMGASANSSFFYSQVKGQLEKDLQGLGFESLILVRPGLITGDRAEFRLGEHVGLLASKILRPILPKKWQPNAAQDIAKTLLHQVILAKLGVQVIEAQDI